jgi:hypothetical protein
MTFRKSRVAAPVASNATVTILPATPDANPSIRSASGSEEASATANHGKWLPIGRAELDGDLQAVQKLLNLAMYLRRLPNDQD